MTNINLDEWSKSISQYLLKYMNVCRDIQIYEKRGVENLSTEEIHIFYDLKLDRDIMKKELKDCIDKIEKYNLLPYGEKEEDNN